MHCLAAHVFMLEKVLLGRATLILEPHDPVPTYR
jgi:hypothetical protein